MVSPVVATFRLAAFVLWTLAALVPYVPLLAVGWKGCPAYVRGYFKVVARICGLRVVAEGAPIETRPPVLFVANHASYIDIIVLGCLLEARFVAKSEVAGWPGFGFLSRMARAVFVDRRRGGTARERDLLRRCLEAGESLILFPEGTSNDGNRVLAFKSSLFAAAEGPVGGEAIRVQPLSVAYTRLDGIPMGRALRPFYAWYGDMTMAGHLLRFLGLGRATAEVVFHRPVTLGDFKDRKALSNHCRDVVAHGVVLALAGRWGDFPPEPQPGLLAAPLPLSPETEA